MPERQEYRIQCYVMVLPDATALNRRIVQQYRAVRDHPQVRRTHYFAGRYENIYVPLQDVPALTPLLDEARQGAARFLQRSRDDLHTGFWFNEMGPGHVTLPHHHTEDDELVSGVYYVSVPPDSGDLILEQGAATTRIKPREGMLVFFAPDVMHQVSENRSDAVRLSIGMNFGPPKD